jgi:hypothetical protein
MKVISLIDRGQLKGREVLKQIASAPPAGQSLSLAEVGKRCRVLRALDKQTGNTLRLEDADWQVLSQAADTFPFGVANIDLLEIVEAIKEAKEAPDLHSIEGKTS